MSGINKGFVRRTKTKIIDNKFDMPRFFILSYIKKYLCCKVLAWNLEKCYE